VVSCWPGGVRSRREPRSVSGLTIRGRASAAGGAEFMSGSYEPRYGEATRRSEAHRLLEMVPTFVDRLARRLLKPGEGEIGDRVGGDDGAVGEGALDGGWGDYALRREVSHHAAGEGVAGAGGIDHLIGGEG